MPLPPKALFITPPKAPAKAKSFPEPFLQVADSQQNLAKSFPEPFPPLSG
jgi:hypothetical protein